MRIGFPYRCKECGEIRTFKQSIFLMRNEGGMEDDNCNCRVIKLMMKLRKENLELKNKLKNRIPKNSFCFSNDVKDISWYFHSKRKLENDIVVLEICFYAFQFNKKIFKNGKIREDKLKNFKLYYIDEKKECEKK